MKSVRARWRTWLRLGVSVSVTAVLLYQVDIQAIATTLARFPPLSVLLAVIAGTLSILPAALAWKLLMDAQGLRVPFWTVQLLYAVGTFFATFTPGGLGSDVVRTFRLQQWTNRGIEAGISILISRALSVLVLLLTAMVTILSRPGLPRDVTIPVALLGLLVCVIGFLAAEPLLTWLTRLWPGVPGAGLLSKTTRALYALRQEPLVAAQTAGLFVAHHVLAILPLYLLVQGIGVDISFIDVVALGLLLRLADFLPISISGIGVHEAGLVLLFGPLGLAPSDAIAVSILERLALLVVPLIGGIAYATGWGSGRTSVEEELARRP